jgi:O-antigen/teichoic acid export membrane protein
MPHGLKARVLRAGAWTVAGHGAAQIIRLGSNLIMTRLLVPEMFGVMAIANTVNVVLGMLSDLGLRQNIIQSKRGDDPAFLDTAWVVQIVRGVVLWALAALLGYAIHLARSAGAIGPASAYAAPELPLVIAVNSLSVVVSGFQSTKMSTAHRRLDQRRIMEIALLGQMAGLAVMVPIGYASRSIWALVAGGLVSALVTTLLSHAWMQGHANRFRVERRSLRELLDFGKWVFVSSGLYVLATAGDRLLLGAFVDARALGLYAIAALLIAAAAGLLHRLYFNVTLPALSEVARNAPGRLREVYAKLGLPGDVALGFSAGLLYACGPLVIDLLYDPRYAEAGPVLSILALSLVAVRYEAARQLYLAVGRPQYGTVLSLVRFVSLCVLVPSLFRLGGVQAAIWGVALHALAVVPFVYGFNARLGVNDYRREAMVLVLIPLGYAAGRLLVGILK